MSGRPLRALGLAIVLAAATLGLGVVVAGARRAPRPVPPPRAPVFVNLDQPDLPGAWEIDAPESPDTTTVTR